MLRIVVIVLCLIVPQIQAQPTLGSCHNYFKPPLLKTDGRISTTLAVRILRHQAPLYPTPQAKQPQEQLEFGLSLDPLHLDTSSGRIQVMTAAATEPLGWVESHDLLCAFSPLLNDKGIERKLFIKTPPSSEQDPQSVTAYPFPDASQCDPEQGIICKQLSRFELYFIFAEDPTHKRYLLAEEYDITLGDKPLIGWVDYDKGIAWNTVLGLRPQKNIVAYPSPQQAKEQSKRIEIQGGKIWYDRSRIAERIPLLDIDESEEFYHVAASGIGIQGFEIQDTQVLEQFKQADIFFLLDGTASMRPYIQSAKQAAQNIVNTLREDINFRETTFRFGFRVYRDVFADALNPLCQQGICEGMPLSNLSCNISKDMSYDNWQRFNSKISEVTETQDDNDDYPEQLLAGLAQALQDIASCPQRTKLLFVMGDHGDKQASLPQSLLQGLKQQQRLIIFFIQSPSFADQVLNAQDYQAAYQRFKTQAQSIIQQVIPAEYKGKTIEREQYRLSLDQAQLVEEIKQLVKLYSESAIINEVAQQIRGGDSLENIIDKWMAKGDMPVLYWQMLDKTACQALGTQCQKTIDHRVIDAYIPITDKVEEEFRMTAIQLDEWRAILRRLSDIKLRPVDEQRQEFIKILRQEIQDILGKPPIYSENDKTLAELMKRKTGLPMRTQSPLLQYSLKDIEQMPRCELRRLLTWISSIHQVLNNVRSSPTLKVSFTLKPYPEKQCPLASDKGQKIAELTFHPPQKLGETEEYRYDRSFRGQVIYWLPTRFLP